MAMVWPRARLARHTVAEVDDSRAEGAGLDEYRAMLDREGASGPADVAIVGDEDTVGAQIGALADAGVTDFVAGEYTGGPDGVRTRAFLRTLLS